jgi:N-acetylmuramoyl-L-alanine amidase
LVLAQTAMPGILIEAGFISNKEEEKYLLSDEGQDYLASAIFRAFRQYKEVIENTSPETITNTTIADKNTDEKQADSEQTALTNLPSEKIDSNEPEVIKATNQPVYKVQILFSENKIDSNSQIFKDFNDVEEIAAEGKYKYVVGSKTTYPEALEYSKWVKNRYPDAFIVAVSNGKILPLSQVSKVKEN